MEILACKHRAGCLAGISDWKVGGQMGLVDEKADRWTDNRQVSEFFNAHHKVHSPQKLPIWY